VDVSPGLAKKISLLATVIFLASCGNGGGGLGIPGPWSLDVVYATNRGSNNISAYQVNSATGALTPVAGSPFAAGTAPTGPIAVAGGYSAFVVNSGANSVPAFRISTSGSTKATNTGALIPLADSPLASGRFPVALVTDYATEALYIINQGDDSISAYKGDVTMSSLTAVAGSPFATGTTPSAVTLGSAVYVVNRGSNSVSVLAVAPTSDVLSPVAGSPFATGSGPTNLAIDPWQKIAVVGNSASANVSAYLIGTGGTLMEVAGSPFAAGTSPVSASIFQVRDASGIDHEYVYVLNGGSNNISAFSVNTTTGFLAPVAGSPFATGTNPTFLSLDPTARFLYVTNGGSSNVSGYAIDAPTGALQSLPGSPYPCGTGPRSLTFDHMGDYVYVANGGSGDISGYAINAVGGLPDSGALTAVPGSPFSSGINVDAVTTYTVTWNPSI